VAAATVIARTGGGRRAHAREPLARGEIDAQEYERLLDTLRRARTRHGRSDDAGGPYVDAPRHPLAAVGGDDMEAAGRVLGAAFASSPLEQPSGDRSATGNAAG
jgi:hypothetical protein